MSREVRYTVFSILAVANPALTSLLVARIALTVGPSASVAGHGTD